MSMINKAQGGKKKILTLYLAIHRMAHIDYHLIQKSEDFHLVSPRTQGQIKDLMFYRKKKKIASKMHMCIYTYIWVTVPHLISVSEKTQRSALPLVNLSKSLTLSWIILRWFIYSYLLRLFLYKWTLVFSERCLTIHCHSG